MRLAASLASFPGLVSTRARPVCRPLQPSREKRYAPGMILPPAHITPQSEIRDFLYTTAWNLHRSWRWMKPYRRLLLGVKRLRYVGELPAFIASDEWATFMRDDVTKSAIESGVRDAAKRVEV